MHRITITQTSGGAGEGCLMKRWMAEWLAGQAFELWVAVPCAGGVPKVFNIDLYNCFVFIINNSLNIVY